MSLKDNRLRALKGFIHADLISSKVLYIVMASTVFGYLAVSTIMSIIMANVGGISSNSGGSLVTGLGSAVICMLVSAIIMAVGKEKRAAFVFPIDRKTYVAGNFIMFVVNSTFLLVIASVVYLFEVAIFKLLAMVYDNIVYMNSVTFGSFITGFWISFFYIMFITTLAYFLFMLFSRYKLPAVVIVAIVVGLPFVFPFGRTALFKIVMFYIGEQSLVLLSIKLLVSAVVFQLLSYLPLRKMEVNA